MSFETIEIKMAGVCAKGYNILETRTSEFDRIPFQKIEF